MLNRCRKCDQILREGELIRVTVTADYHELKSRVHFAINRNIHDADAATLEHVDCLEGQR